MGCSADLSGLGTTPQGWIEPASNSTTPSGYLTKLLSEVSDGHYPTRKQLQVLAVFVEHLDIVKQQEDEGVPWNLRVQLVILLLGQGGCGKTWLVQQFIAKVVAYAFCTDEAIRMIAFFQSAGHEFILRPISRANSTSSLPHEGPEPREQHDEPRRQAIGP